MPTYEYLCTNCGHELEEFQSMKEPSLTLCPNCKTESLVRIMGGGAGLIFKGTGFYITDYKKTSSSARPLKTAGNGKTGDKRDSDRQESGKRDSDRQESGKKDSDRQESGKKDSDRQESGKRDSDKKESGKNDQGRKDSGKKDSSPEKT
jgi:putative FmdB family regulatory protein